MVGVIEPFGARAARTRLGRVPARHAGRALGRLADPAQVLVLARALVTQHVHVDRPWCRTRLSLQPRSGARPRRVSGGISRARRCGRHVLRGAAVIVTLVMLGDLLQLRAMGRTSQAVRDLLRLAPNLAWRLREDGTEEQVKLEDVQVGDRLRVKPGEKVPSTASCSRAPAASTNRWSRASLCQSPKRLETTSPERRSTARDRSFSAPSASAPTRCLRASCTWSAKPRGRARRSSGWPISLPCISSISSSPSPW